MKWIGQHIYDLVSRFRNDVFLEGISTSTETDILVVDSSNKISKRAASGLTSGTATLASTVTVTDSTTDTAFPVVFHDESNALLDDTGAFTYNPNTGTLIAPNLTVSGTTTTINTTNLNVEDKNIILNYHATSDTSSTADGAGITIQDAVDASNDASLTWTAADDTFEFSHAVEINNGASGGTAALLIDNDDVDQIALDIDAANTTANIIDINAQALTTANVINIDSNNLEVGGSLIKADWDLTGDGHGHHLQGIYLDIDKSGGIGSSQTNNIYGLRTAFNDNGTNAGSSQFYGTHTTIVDDNASGFNNRYGHWVKITGGDASTSYGLQTQIENGGFDLKCMSSATIDDYFTLAVGANGATTLSTVDTTTGAVGHFEIEADGNIILDPQNATTGVQIDGTANTTANALNIDCDALTTGNAIFVDVDSALTTTNTLDCMKIDYDKSSNVASGQTVAAYGLEIDMNDNATSNVGNTQMTGIHIGIDSANANGLALHTGVAVNLTDADTALTTGFSSFVEDGGVDFKAMSSADSGDYFTIATTTHGATTLTTVDDDAAVAHLTFDVDGFVISDSSEGRYYFQKDGGNSGDDYCLLEVGDNGDVHLSSNDGAGSSGHFEIAANNGNIILDSDGTTDIESVGLIKTTGAGVEIENGSSAGASALLIDNDDVDQIALNIDAENTTANIIDIGAEDLTTGNVININCDSLVGANNGARVINLTYDDARTTGTSAYPAYVLYADINKTGNIASGQYGVTKGCYFDFSDTGTNVGTSWFTGFEINCEDSNNDGSNARRAFQATITGGDPSITMGLMLQLEDGSKQLLFQSSADSGDQAHWITTTNGATTITTQDDDGEAAHFEIAADGDITLDSAAQIKLEPAAGSNILLDGTVAIDAGVVTGATSITSTTFVGNRTLAVTSGTDGDHDGDVVYFGGTTSMTTGAIYHYNSSGNWELADADDNTKSDGLLGVALGAASDTNGVLLRGMVTIDHDPGDIGDVLYLTTTAGDCSATAPSGNGNIVRIIGYQVSHASNGNIWFNPDSTFVEVNA